MTDIDYEQKVKKIESKAKTQGEKVVNKLFLDLGFDFVDCNIVVKEGEEEIGEIDGLFRLKDDYLLILETDDEKKASSRKIGEFYSKWSDKKNIKKIQNKYKINRAIESIRIFIANKSETPVGNTKKSLRHHFEGSSNNKILYKDDIKYFQESFSIIGKWARNDLINFIGLHKKPKHMIEKDALRISIGEHKAYLFSATAYELLNSCYIYRRRDRAQKGYQRILKPKRINKIKKFIGDKKSISFPNSLIISCSKRLEDSEHEETGGCKINFPTGYCSSKVVDGQHRLLGFANAEEHIQKEHCLPIIAFDDMKDVEEAKTFITINTEQKNIDPNLLLILKSDFPWDKGSKFFNEKQAVLVIKKLNDIKNSPLHKKIFLGYNPPRSGKITLATLVSAVLGNNLVAGNRHLLQQNIEDIKTPYKEIRRIFAEMKRSLPDYCDFKKINQTEGFFFSNKGLRVIFRLIQFLIRNEQKGNIKIGFHGLFKDLNSIVDDKLVNDLQKYYGEGGATKATGELMKKLKITKEKKYKKFKVNLRQI